MKVPVVPIVAYSMENMVVPMVVTMVVPTAYLGVQYMGTWYVW